MRITFVMSGVIWIPSGSYRVVYEYANVLVRKGHTVNIVFPLSKTKASAPFSIQAFRKRIAGLTPKWFDLDKSVNLIKVSRLRSEELPNSDVMIAANWDVVATLYEACKVMSVPVLQFVHHYEALTGHAKRLVDETLHLPVPKIAVSSWTAKMLKELNFDRVYRVSNGIDLKRFKILDDWIQRPLVIGMSFVDKPGKDMQTAIEVLRRVKQARPEVSLILFGPTKTRPNLPFEFEYFFRLPENQLIHKIYNRSSVFLSTSKFEGFSFPQIEAMACGCVVVSTRCGGNGDFALHKETALLSDVGDVATLTENCLKLCTDNRLRRQLGKSAQEKIQEFSWEKSTTLLLKTIEHNR